MTCGVGPRRRSLLATGAQADAAGAQVDADAADPSAPAARLTA
ncbi:hypothetical protein WME97_20765 [Sorangium sp. So ce367]